jgi:hypothetical protein
MGLADYFQQNRYHGTFEFMERVTGVYQGIRWMGTVGTDSIVSEDNGPEVTVQLDLPLRVDDKIHHVLRLPHADVKRMRVFD